MKKIFTKFILLLTLVSFFNNAFAEVKVYSLYNPQIPISTTQTAISTTNIPSNYNLLNNLFQSPPHTSTITSTIHKKIPKQPHNK
jgi:hypothetical protein